MFVIVYLGSLVQALRSDLSGLNPAQLFSARLTAMNGATAGMAKTSLHVVSCPLPGSPWRIQCWKHFQPKIKSYKASRPRTCTTLCSSKRLTRPAQIQGLRKETAHPDGKSLCRCLQFITFNLFFPRRK